MTADPCTTWEERAAIIEEACRVSREVAERMATQQQKREEARGNQGDLWCTK